MKGTYRNATLSAILVLGMAAGAYGINESEPRAMALGGAYTAMARGPNAVAWNPANLALRSSPKFKWELLAAGLTFAMENNAFSVQTYNDNFTSGDLLDESAKRGLLNDVQNRGLKFNVDIEPILAAGIPINGGVAFPMPWGLRSAITTTFSIGVEGELPKDMFELFLFGNEFDRAYDIADWDGSAWVIGSLNFAGAKPWMPKQLKPYLNEFAVGATFKILGGAYGEVQRSEGTLISQIHTTNFNASLITRSGGGSGVGLDFGAAGVTRDKKTTFSVGLLNLIDTISWGISSRQDSVFAVATDLRVTKFVGGATKIEDVLDNPRECDFTSTCADADADSSIAFQVKLNDDSFSRSMPAMLRIGVAYDLQPRLTLAANYDQAFSDGFGITTTPRISGGAEYRLVTWFPVRGGLSVGGRSNSTSVGFSIGPFSVFHMQLTLMDMALATRGGLLPGVAKGSAFSIMFFRFNLIS